MRVQLSVWVWVGVCVCVFECDLRVFAQLPMHKVINFFNQNFCLSQVLSGIYTTIQYARSSLAAFVGLTTFCTCVCVCVFVCVYLSNFGQEQSAINFVQ